MAKPSDTAIVLSAEEKEEFVKLAKESDAFNKLMERTSHVTAKAEIKWGKNCTFDHFAGISKMGIVLQMTAIR